MLSPADLYQAFDTAPDAIVAFLVWLKTEGHLPSRPHLADIGAGPGRLVAPIATLGWKVTAYEPDPEYFPALEAAARKYPFIVARQGGFQDISEVNAFDVACGINSSYAHLVAPSDRAMALRLLARALRPGGVLILDLPNFPWILANYRAPSPQNRSWGRTTIRRHREHHIDRQRGTFTTIDHDEMTEGGVTATTSKTHTYAIVSHEIHLAELAAAGFHEVQLFPGFDARESAAVPASRLLYVARNQAVAPGRR